MKYHENKARAVTFNTEPTMTDQSAAHDTDINVIVDKFAQHGQLPQHPKPPISGDFTGLPVTLAEAFEAAKTIQGLHARMPEQLRSMPIQELMALTPQQLTDKLKKQPPAEPPTEEKKGDT